MSFCKREANTHKGDNKVYEEGFIKHKMQFIKYKLQYPW